MSNDNVFDLAVIGGGSGGLSLSAGTAQLGLKVALIEGHKMGGDCLNYGCVPSKALLAAAKSIYQARHQAPKFGVVAEFKSVDFTKVMQHVHSVIKTIEPHDSVERFESLGVKVFQEQGQFLDANTIKAGAHTIKAGKIVIATGSSPFVPAIKGIDSTKYLTNETIFDLSVLPEHLIVVGGGPIGCELAQAFAMLGSKVTIIEAMTILPKDDKDCVAVVRQSLQGMGIDILEDAQVNEVIQKDESTIDVKMTASSEDRTLTGSHLLMATGRRANVERLHLDKAGVSSTKTGIAVNARLQTSQKHIFAIGDVAGPYQFTHMASYQAGIVLRNIVFKIPAKASYEAVPWVTYTYPELAHVGKAESDISDRSDFIMTEWPFSRSDRAQTEDETNGKIKVLTDKKGKIAGVTIVGLHAGELILPWVMAVREGKSLRAFTDTIAPYPTLSEVSKQVAGEFYKPRLFSKKVLKLVSWLQKLWW
ncbi:dihydrolipoyl dehydrogenase family protein [Legionella spiritensis]|uniref:Mercuric reductase n=1 Tax=Legionella spiritensis TaxID=452 RepID=A0A0W0Z593_LEGSP|nr:FAD-dependent oxidoreductase [Legionella spiritensis]KTD64292.1 mercuric reductase [Legionella spiritensis]SNV46856.1 mercuric reductase [Legionella spiritensis]